jgi:5'-nucleotidase
VTISGTVGAALEAAAHGIPALAASLEASVDYHLSYSEELDFSVAAYFTACFARTLLERRMPPDVHVLKIDVPSDATLQTPWEITRLSTNPYFFPVAPTRRSWDEPTKMGYRSVNQLESEPPGTDVYALRVQRAVAVTPLSLDLTSRVDFGELKNYLRSEG